MNAEPQVRHITKLVREGNLAADVEVRVVERYDLFAQWSCANNAGLPSKKIFDSKAKEEANERTDRKS